MTKNQRKSGSCLWHTPDHCWSDSGVTHLFWGAGVSALVIVKKFVIEFIDRESDEVLLLFGVVLHIIIKVE